MNTEIKGYAPGLAWDNTKPILVLARPWAHPTLGRVFMIASAGPPLIAQPRSGSPRPHLQNLHVCHDAMQVSMNA